MAINSMFGMRYKSSKVDECLKIVDEIGRFKVRDVASRTEYFTKMVELLNGMDLKDLTEVYYGVSTKYPNPNHRRIDFILKIKTEYNKAYGTAEKVVNEKENQSVKTP